MTDQSTRTTVNPEPEPEALRGLLGQLNEHLGPYTPYKLDLVRPADPKPAPKNAHYMPKRMFDRLTENIRRDGNLSTLPFYWKTADGEYLILSGHHRIESAQAAGVGWILILYTDAALSESERIAIQLSHNALHGEENPVLLRELWESIAELDLKVYAGLDDGLLKTLEPVEVARLNEAPLRFEELRLLFLPAESDRVVELLKRIGAVKRPALAAPIDQWDRFWNTLLNYKEAEQIVNTGTAFLTLCEIAEQRIAELAAAQEGAPDDPS